MTIRRLVEYIRVMKDNSIIIVLKGGMQIQENIEKNKSLKPFVSDFFGFGKADFLDFYFEMWYNDYIDITIKL